MATLKCNSCGGDIASNARRVQCPHCGDMFPFTCAKCDRKLRPPFNVFDDEHYLTFDTPPQPLCDEHYLRQCPDCNDWFGADENPGYFRCAGCAEKHRKLEAQADQSFAAAPMPALSTATTGTASGGGVATRTRPQSAATPAPTKGGPNVVAIGVAVLAVVGIVGWMLLHK